MNFAEVEQRVAAEHADTDAWMRYPHLRSQVDGVVHRVVRVHHLTHYVHDEAMTAQFPITGCGIGLSYPEFRETPEAIGFCGDDVPLSCMRCASGRPEEGDAERVAQKAKLFGVLYGGAAKQVLTASRMPSKSTSNAYSLKALAQTYFGGGPMRHRAVVDEPPPVKKPRLREVLARAAWGLLPEIR